MAKFSANYPMLPGTGDSTSAIDADPLATILSFSYSGCRKVVIEGETTSGKTTLAEKLCAIDPSVLLVDEFEFNAQCDCPVAAEALTPNRSAVIVIQSLLTWRQSNPRSFLQFPKHYTLVLMGRNAAYRLQEQHRIRLTQKLKQWLDAQQHRAPWQYAIVVNKATGEICPIELAPQACA